MDMVGKAPKLMTPRCQFLELPTEIRLRIYELTFKDDYFEVIWFDPYRDTFPQMICEEPHEVSPPDSYDLLGVSKQIHQEASEVLLKSTLFAYHLVVTNSIEPDVFRVPFQHSLGPFSVKEMRRIFIVIGVDPPDQLCDTLEIKWSADRRKGQAEWRIWFDEVFDERALCVALQRLKSANNLLAKNFTRQDIANGMTYLDDKVESCTFHELIHAVEELFMILRESNTL
ncbi:MAG: hypothetical protein Q9157_008601 [Trypethelium eluteriae]